MSAPSHSSQAEFSRRGFLGSLLGASALSMTSPLVARAVRTRAGGSDGLALLDDYVGRLCYNENPLGPSPLARSAILSELDLGHRYPDWYAESLRYELAAHHSVSAGQTLAGCGGTEILRLAALAFSEPGRNIVSPYPTYSQFPSDCSLLGAEVRYSNLDANYRVNLNDMLTRVDSNTTAVGITNPNNPTATVLSAAALSSFVNALPPSVVVVIDEAYHEYVSDPGYGTAVSLVRQGKNVVVIRTFSKAFGLAGVRVGYAIGNVSRISQMSGWQVIASVSRLAGVGAAAALDDQQHVDATKALNTQAKDYCFAAFATMGLAYIPSQTNFFMVDVGQPAGPVSSALAARGIDVRTGWGMPRHLRVSTGTMEDMTAFIAALQDILAASPAGGQDPTRRTGLYGSYPNPCSEGAHISLSVAGRDRADLQLFDITGRRVRTIFQGSLAAGFHEVAWDGTDDAGHRVAAGTYFYRLSCGDAVHTRRLIVVE